MYPNGIVAEPDGSIVWVESYTRRVVRRRPDGSIDVIHELAEGHIPDGFKIDTEGNFWITTFSSGGLDVIAAGRELRRLPRHGRRPAQLRVRRHVAVRLRLRDDGHRRRGPDVRPAPEGGRRRLRHAAVPRRDLLKEGEMRIESIEAIPVSYPEPNDFNALRHLCLCKITADDGQVGWGESITQFPEANFATKAVIEGMADDLIGRDPRPQRGALAAVQGPGVVVRLRRRDRRVRRLGDRHRALGPEGQGARRERARPARRAGAREAAGDRVVPRPLRVDPGDGRGGAGVALDRAPGREGRLRQARQRAARLRARPRRRVRPRDARGDRRGPDADDRLRDRDQVGRDRRGAPDARHGAVRADLGRGAARRVGPGGLREPAREDDDADRVRRARVDARRLRAHPRDRDLSTSSGSTRAGPRGSPASSSSATASRPTAARRTRTRGRPRS